MIHVPDCSVCGAPLEESLRLAEYPLVTSAVGKKAQVPLLPIVVGSCRSCSHLQLMQRPTSEQLDAIYLGDYTSVVRKGTFAGADGMAVDCKTFLDFAAGSVKAGGTVMEIGCFDGGFLSLFGGCNLLGCEPNPGGRMAAESIGIRVIPEYFAASLFEPKSLDLIVMRHLIEHVPNPSALLQECRGLLSEGGTVLVETPNIEHTLNNHVIGNFYHQHLQYFSAHSLRVLAERAGYRIVAHGIKDFRQFMVIAPATAKISDSSHYFGTVDGALAGYRAYLQQLKSQVVGWFAQNRHRVAIYGASSTGTGIVHLSGIPIDRIAYAVDGDPQKAGCLLPGTQIQVHPPERLLEDPVETVIIASDFYFREIRSLLERRYAGVVRRVIGFHPGFKVTEIG